MFQIDPVLHEILKLPEGSLQLPFRRGSLSEFHHLAHGHQRKYPHQHLSSF